MEEKLIIKSKRYNLKVFLIIIIIIGALTSCFCLQTLMACQVAQNGMMNAMKLIWNIKTPVIIRHTPMMTAMIAK